MQTFKKEVYEIRIYVFLFVNYNYVLSIFLYYLHQLWLPGLHHPYDDNDNKREN